MRSPIAKSCCWRSYAVTQERVVESATKLKNMALAAMESTNTVRAKIEGWFLEQDRILAIKPRDRIHEQDRKNVLKQSFFALGCARAGLDRLEASYQQKHLPFLQDAYQALDRELNDCRTQIFAAVSAPTLNSNFEEKLSLRAWAINLAGRCSQSAVVAASGAANAKTNAAQRVYREALLFSVAAQTTAAMEATLAQLLRTEKSWRNFPARWLRRPSGRLRQC